MTTVDSSEKKKNKCERCGAPNSSICAHMNCQDYISQSEQMPAKPKFKVGDKAQVKQGLGKFEVVTIVYYDSKINAYRVEFVNEDAVGCLWYAESALEPYTYTKEESRNLSQETSNCNKQFDNILKDSSLKERRLNIMAMAMQGIMANPDPQMVSMDVAAVVNLSGIIADALIAKAEEGGADEKD